MRRQSWFQAINVLECCWTWTDIKFTNAEARTTTLVIVSRRVVVLTSLVFSDGFEA